ncbi:MAG: dihydropyrimidinase [Lachnospirales bacterium]
MIILDGLITNYNESFLGNIRIENGIISEIGNDITQKNNEEIVNAKGCIILPGGIDVHTHFDMPAENCMTSDNFYTGTAAAIAGGTTTVIDFAEPDLGSPLKSGLDTWKLKSNKNSFCDYSFHMTVSHWSDDMDKQIEEMLHMGITSFKSYTAYKDSIGVEDAELEKIMKSCKKNQAILCIHCEDGDKLNELKSHFKAKDPTDINNHPKSRPNQVEASAIKKVIKMAETTGATIYIVHVSTSEGLQEIKEAKNKNISIYAETCPHYLFLNENKYMLENFESAKYVMSPPLRHIEDQQALGQAIKSDLIDVVSTDHCSFNYKGQKELGLHDFTKIPNGIPSVEHRLILMHQYSETHGISPEKIVEITSYNPARIFGLLPNKGQISVGADADIVIIKKVPPYEITANEQKQCVDYTPYEGICVEHKIKAVYLRGQLVYNGKDVLGSPTGNFISRKKNERE